MHREKPCEQRFPRMENYMAAENGSTKSGVAESLLDADLTRVVIGCFFRVHSRLRSGYLESVYVEALRRELSRAGLHVEKEAVLDVWDEGEKVGHFRADLLVERRLVLEAKAGDFLPSTSRKKLIHYLRCIDQQLGLLLHFGPKAKFYRVIQTTNLGRERRSPP